MGSTIHAVATHHLTAKAPWHSSERPHKWVERPERKRDKITVERSHRSDGQEFYQLLSYKGDVDLEAKLDEWERFYNFHRPQNTLRRTQRKVIINRLDVSQETAPYKAFSSFGPTIGAISDLLTLSLQDLD